MKVIIFQSTKKLAIQQAEQDYYNPVFKGVFKYSKGKGNNFYNFDHAGEKKI